MQAAMQEICELSASGAAPCVAMRPRPRFVPDKRVYRGGILTSEDAARAYVHVHDPYCVSPEYS